MVLAELGASLTSAFQKLARSPTLDEETVKQILKEIVSALISSDVNVQMVKMLRENVLSKVIHYLKVNQQLTRLVELDLLKKQS